MNIRAALQATLYLAVVIVYCVMVANLSDEHFRLLMKVWLAVCGAAVWYGIYSMFKSIQRHK